mgnify:FL=1
MTPPDLRVRLELLPPEEGGRTRPVSSGIRPHYELVVDGKPLVTTAMHTFAGGVVVEPGGSAEAEVRFIAYYPDTLCVGDVVSVKDGPHVIGYATVLEVSNPILERKREAE